ncbi:bifunctional nicotinamidase/pyrazinamidase [[Eubacterium] cellulosolvens]
MRIEDLKLLSKVRVKGGDALIIVDMQNDFIPPGALSVKGGDEIISSINTLSELFHRGGNVITLTQDWHPPRHMSFASSHNMKPYQAFESDGVGPVLWPDHCVQGTWGASFHPSIKTDFATAIVRKGFHPNVDSYSTFIENDKKTYTGLSGYLISRGVKGIFLCGLALDYCVYYSAVDGLDQGFRVVVVIDLCKAINSPPSHLSKALDQMVEKGVQFIYSKNIEI